MTAAPGGRLRLGRRRRGRRRRWRVMRRWRWLRGRSCQGYSATGLGPPGWRVARGCVDRHRGGGAVTRPRRGRGGRGWRCGLGRRRRCGGFRWRGWRRWWSADRHRWCGCCLLGFWWFRCRGWCRWWSADRHRGPGRLGCRFGLRFTDNRFGLGRSRRRDGRRLRGELGKRRRRGRWWSADRHRRQGGLRTRRGGPARRSRGGRRRWLDVDPRRRRRRGRRGRWTADGHRRQDWWWGRRLYRDGGRWRRRLRPIEGSPGVAVDGGCAGERRIRVKERLFGIVVGQVGILGGPKELVIVGRHENLSEVRQMREAREGARSPGWVELAQSRASRFYAYRDRSYANNPVTLPSVDCMAWLASLIVRARFCRELLSSCAVPSHFC